jgi:ABC-type transporter Mla subunit MlaD
MKRSLEASVKRLAGALDALETRLETRIADLGAKSEAIDAARTQARVAKTQAAAAAEDLADAIRDLKSLIAETEGR